MDKEDYPQNNMLSFFNHNYNGKQMQYYSITTGHFQDSKEYYINTINNLRR